MSARAAAERLRIAAAALLAALREGDEQAVAEAFGERERSFAALAAVGQAARPPDLGELLREVARLDALALGLAEQRLQAVRRELDELGRARELARAVRGEAQPARFVSRRV